MQKYIYIIQGKAHGNTSKLPGISKKVMSNFLKVPKNYQEHTRALQKKYLESYGK